MRKKRGRSLPVSRETVDGGTRELSQRHKVRPERRQSGQVHIRVLDGNQIDALLWGDKISPDQHSILVGFQVDLHRASLLGPRAATLEARVSGGAYQLSHAEAVARLKVNQAITHLQNTTSRETAELILKLCLEDKEVPVWQVPNLVRACESLTRFREVWREAQSEA